MAAILAEQIFALFIMIICGFSLVKLKYLKPSDYRVLSILSVKLLYPCVIIGSFQIDYTEEIRNGFLLVIAAAVIVQAIMMLLSYVLRKLFSLSPVEMASVFYSSTANMVIPLVTSVLGSEWVIYTSAFMCIQTCLIWTHGQALIAGNGGRNLKKILCNPNVIASVLGIVLFFGKVKLPVVVEDAVSGMGNIVGTISMFVIGGLLAEADWKKVLVNGRLWLVSVLRLVVLPVVVLFFLKYSGLAELVENGTQILMITLLAASTPATATIVQMAQLYNREQVYASQINVLTTILSIVTMPLMIALYWL